MQLFFLLHLHIIFNYHSNSGSLIYIYSYIVKQQQQELFVKGLAQSKTFQKFAVHTDRHVQKYKKEGFEHVNSQIDELHKQATRAAYSTSTKGSAGGTNGAGAGKMITPPQKPMEGVAGFFNALGKVIRKDLGI